MKLTILGAGAATSQLLNLPDQYPPTFLVEWSDKGSNDSSGPNEKILFECGEALRFRLAKAGFDFASIEHLAISHPHADHMAFPQYLQAVYIKQKFEKRTADTAKLHVYSSSYITQLLPKLFHEYFPERTLGSFYDLPQVFLHDLPRENGIAIGNAKLTAAEVYHAWGKCPALAFRLETPQSIFAYSGDTGECEGIRAISKNADIFVCEASAYVGDTASTTGYGHLTPRNVGDIALAGDVKKLILVHYNGKDSDEAMTADCRASGFTGEIVIGKDFQVFEI